MHQVPAGSERRSRGAAGLVPSTSKRESPMHFLRASAFGVCVTLGFPFLSTALSQHHPIADLIGDVPDTSNWPHPAATTGNPFVRSTAPPPDIALRDSITQLGKTVF